MPHSPTPLVVVTDLDGTLLDHHTYRAEAAQPALDRLAARGVPVVVNTSKTRSEWLAMREAFDNTDAFVVENGSALYLPDGTCEVFGKTRQVIVDKLAFMRADYQFESYADWTVADVAKHTGLDLDSAALSQAREFSEPVRWMDSDDAKQRFCQALAKAGFATLEGGRFLHALGVTDKGKALPVLRDFYQAETIIALGDSPNDIAMLRQADIGIVIPAAVNEPLQFDSSNRIIRSVAAGPEGWNQSINALLDEGI